MYTEDRVVVAADELSLDQCLELASRIKDRVYAIKVHNVYDEHGPSVVGRLHDAGVTRVWVDYKLKDIPNTVKLRAKAIARSGADILTVHASGEIEMMMAALESGIQIYGITVLTSLDEEQAHLLTGQPVKAAVLYRARLAKLAGIHAVVCSPNEVDMLAKRPELKGLEFVTPGIRSEGKDKGDQKRIGTPGGALKAGSHRLVIGRQITGAADPVQALEELEQEIDAALAA